MSSINISGRAAELYRNMSVDELIDLVIELEERVAELESDLDDAHAEVEQK